MLERDLAEAMEADEVEVEPREFLPSLDEVVCVHGAIRSNNVFDGSGMRRNRTACANCHLSRTGGGVMNGSVPPTAIPLTISML